MTYTIELDTTDLPREYTKRSGNLIETQLESDLFDLSREMDRVEPGNRERALGFAILEALERRETGNMADSAPDDDVDRTPRGKLNLSEHTNPSDDSDGTHTATDAADDGVRRTKRGKLDLSEHTGGTDD